MISKINVLLALFILGGCAWILFSFRDGSKITVEKTTPATPVVVRAGDETLGGSEIPTTDTTATDVTKKPTDIVSQEVQIVPDSRTNRPLFTPTAYMQSGKIISYKNRDFGYSFDMPGMLYYSGFGSQGGAKHTVGIQPNTSPETLEASSIRVYFYGKKILPEVSVSSPLYQDPQGKYVVILINDSYSIKIESDDIRSDKVQTILQTLKIDS